MGGRVEIQARYVFQHIRGMLWGLVQYTFLWLYKLYVFYYLWSLLVLWYLAKMLCYCFGNKVLPHMLMMNTFLELLSTISLSCYYECKFFIYLHALVGLYTIFNWYLHFRGLLDELYEILLFIGIRVLCLFHIAALNKWCMFYTNSVADCFFFEGFVMISYVFQDVILN